MLSLIQTDFLVNANYSVNIAEGAVSSGKSHIALLRFLLEVSKGPPGPMVICGKSERTIKSNVIEQMYALIGDCFRYKQKVGEINLFNRTIYLVGGNDSRAESKLRGSTYAGALVDEVTVLPESFYKMLLSRLRIPNAKLFATTNPDSPFHWFKRDYLDRESELDQKTWSFTLEDNPSLTEKYKENIKKMYTGIWYDRFILGKWTVAEGRVYDCFDENLHVLNEIPNDPTEYIVGIDYGTVNPCVFLLVGINHSSYPRLWVEREYYYDSKARQRQKTDEELAEDLQKFTQCKNVKAIYVDPSAASFKIACARIGIFTQDAENDVLNGIRTVSTLFSSGDLKISPICKNLIKELHTYAWDESAVRRGWEKPKKENDHCSDAARYALYTHFKQLNDVKGMDYTDILSLQNRNDVHPYLKFGEPAHAVSWN